MSRTRITQRKRLGKTKTDKQILKTLSVGRTRLGRGAAVVIEPVSANSLCKTGVFRKMAGDFPRFCPRDWETGSLETSRIPKKPGFPGLYGAGCKLRPDAGLTGWGGRDRTSEWRNQNPPDYSMIPTRIWKNAQNCALTISIAWRLFPNECEGLRRGNRSSKDRVATSAPQPRAELEPFQQLRRDTGGHDRAKGPSRGFSGKPDWPNTAHDGMIVVSPRNFA